MSAQAVRRARTVIVHSRFARDYLLRAGCRTPIVVTPHPLVERDDEIDAARERRAKGLDKDRPARSTGVPGGGYGEGWAMGQQDLRESIRSVNVTAC